MKRNDFEGHPGFKVMFRTEENPPGANHLSLFMKPPSTCQAMPRHFHPAIYGYCWNFSPKMVTSMVMAKPTLL
jgi:hypothetical protein